MRKQFSRVAAIMIRSITDVDELRAVEELQIAVWGMPERDVVPLHHLLAASGAGGRVLGAFAPDGTIVGFCYGFAGVRGGRRLFYSHMAGVLTAYRDRDVGFRLKQAQRDAALTDGIDWMVWTYDPLQGGNAYFNLHKLGAETRRYYVNYYGAMNDALNRGSESDRLEVDWWLRDPRVEALMAGRPAPIAPDPGELQRIGVPSNITALRRHDPDAAAEWRRTTRERFLEAFAAGYVAVDAERTADRVTYLLVRRPPPAGGHPNAHRTR
jgi:predicted GNAT superfamily acetyltransferase